MKKIILCLGLMTVLMLSSCGKKEEKTTETIENNTTTVETDTVMVKDTAAAETEGTSVKIDTKIEVKK